MLLLFSCTESWACGTYVLILLAVEIVMLVFISEDGGESILRTAIQMGGFAGMIYFLWQALVLLFTLPIFLDSWSMVASSSSWVASSFLCSLPWFLRLDLIW